MIHKKHENKHLQSAWDKYSADNFRFSIIIICDPEFVGYYEQICLDNLKPEYNKAFSVEHSTFGRIVSEETKRKLSIARRNRPPASDETRKKMSETLKRLLIENPDRPRFLPGGKQRLGQHPTEETRKKLSEWQKGRKLPESTKEKIRIANTGKIHTWGYKTSIANKGRSVSDETRKKISKSLKIRNGSWIEE